MNATLDFQLKMEVHFIVVGPSNRIMMIIRAIINKGVIFLEKPARFPFQKPMILLILQASTSQIKYITIQRKIRIGGNATIIGGN